MAYIDGKRNVRVKVLEFAQVMACLGNDIGGCVELRLTQEQMQKLRERGLWFEEVTTPESMEKGNLRLAEITGDHLAEFWKNEI